MTRHHWPSATTAIAPRLPPQLSPPPPNPSKKKDEKKEIGVDEAEVEIEGGGRGDVSASMCLACPAHRGREEQITFRGEERASSLRAPTLRRKKSKAPPTAATTVHHDHLILFPAAGVRGPYLDRIWRERELGKRRGGE
jgi:hypothetical protein